MSVVSVILMAMKSQWLPVKYRLEGIATTRELLGGGLSPTRIRTLVRRGHIVSLGRGVYVTADLAERLRAVPTGEFVMQAAAALATDGVGSVASHHTAALIHGLDLLGTVPPVVTITRPPGLGSNSGKAGVHVHVARLPAAHVGGRLAVPVTTVARTVIDLARSCDFRAGVVVADSALHQRLTSKKKLRAVLADCPRIRGVQRAAEVVEFADGLSESVLESVARVVFRERMLPPPELQVRIADDKFIGRVDFLWPQFVTIAEVDGAMKYADQSRAMLQLRRDARLRDAGYEVVHFSWQEITEAPAEVAASIRSAFRRGSRNPEAPGPAA